MDPATGLVSLVSVLGVYVQEHRHREGEQKEELRDWLARNNYHKILDAIAENTELSDQINHILRMNHDDLVFQLNAIERSVAAIASSLSGFSKLPEIVAPDHLLSTQAIEILKIMEATRAESLIEGKSRMGGGRKRIFSLMGTGKNYSKSDRFIDSDLNELVELGYQHIKDYNPDLKPIYILTRSGSELAKNYLNEN